MQKKQAWEEVRQFQPEAFFEFCHENYLKTTCWFFIFWSATKNCHSPTTLPPQTCVFNFCSHQRDLIWELVGTFGVRTYLSVVGDSGDAFDVTPDPPPLSTCTWCSSSNEDLATQAHETKAPQTELSWVKSLLLEVVSVRYFEVVISNITNVSPWQYRSQSVHLEEVMYWCWVLALGRFSFCEFDHSRGRL